MKHLIATAAFTATLCACGPMHVCTPTETRCAGSFVEVCDAVSTTSAIPAWAEMKASVMKMTRPWRTAAL